jgi:MFS family permease
MYIASVIGGMLFFLPILALYFEKQLFTVTNVALVFSIEAVAMVLFEIPTGAIADLFGRKTASVLAYFFVIMAVLFLYIGGGMTMFVLYAILNAFAHGLASGTASALIYDTLRAEGKEQYYKKIIGTYQALWPLGASIGAIIGGYLAKISLSLPVLTTFIPLIIALVLLLFIEEPEYEKEEHRNIFRHMFSSAGVVLKNRQILILLFGGFLLMALGESVHLLKPLFLTFKQIPIEYFGYIFAVTFGLSSLGHYLSHDVSEKFGNKKVILFSVIGSVIFSILAPLTGSWVAVFFLVGSSVFFGLRNPVIGDLINAEAVSSKRATIISINNFAGQLGVAIFAPFVGYIADLYTINTAYLLTGIMLISTVVIFSFLKDKTK